MGACASKFKVLKDAADAPLPEVASKELKLDETAKKDDAPATDEEAKRQSLGHLFKGNEVKKGSAESNVKVEDVKQEDAPEPKSQEKENVKSTETVVAAPVNDETEKLPATDALKSETKEENKAEEKLTAFTKLETSVKVETLKTEKAKEQKPGLDAEKKETEEKPAEITKVETKKIEEKPVEITKPETEETQKIEEQNAEKKKIEEEPAETTKIETSEKVEDKQVIEPLKTEKPAENKPDAKIKEQIPVSDAGKVKAGEETKQ